VVSRPWLQAQLSLAKTDSAVRDQQLEAGASAESPDGLYAQERIAIGDLNEADGLKDFSSERDFNRARKTREAVKLVDPGVCGRAGDGSHGLSLQRR